MIQTFRDLDVYQQGYQLALEVHRLTLTFPTVDHEETRNKLVNAYDVLGKRVYRLRENWQTKSNI